jgi:hypothetical protein
VDNNARLLDVVGNRVRRNLQCLNNSMLIIGGGNNTHVCASFLVDIDNRV